MSASFFGYSDLTTGNFKVEHSACQRNGGGIEVLVALSQEAQGLWCGAICDELL